MHGFELVDLIRVNQLVRNRMDIEGFRAWYSTLDPARRKSLTHLLCEFAHQAGVNDEMWNEALIASGLPTNGPVVQQVWSVRRTEWPTIPLYQMVEGLSDEALSAVFELFVYLFGIAESRVFQNESKRYCNHWWHRDLLDARVVQ